MSENEPPSDSRRDLGEVLNSPHLFADAPDLPDPAIEPPFNSPRRRARRARRGRYCDQCSPPPYIAAGTVYIEHRLPPRAEPFYADQWSVLAMCRWCAEARGLLPLIEARETKP